MPLTPLERKARLPHGAQKTLAGRHRLLRSQVSEGIAGVWNPKTKKSKERLRRLQLAVAAVLALPLEDVWSPEELAASEPVVLARAS